MKVTLEIAIENDRHDGNWTAVSHGDNDVTRCAGMGKTFAEALGGCLYAEATRLLGQSDLAGELARVKSMHERASEQLGDMTRRYEEMRVSACELRKKVDAQAVLLCPGKASE